MSIFYIISWVLFFYIVVMSVRKSLISTYKIAYYEEALNDKNVDISHIENITLTEIIKISNT